MLRTLFFTFFILWAFFFSIRTIACVALRPFGLWSPEYYARFPRLPWRNLQIVRADFNAWYEKAIHGGKRQTGGWLSTLTTLTKMYYTDLYYLGRARVFELPWLQPIGEPCEAHVTMFAQAGAGKSNVLKTWIAQADPRKAIVSTDPKGDFYKTVGSRMAQNGRNVINIDLEGKFGGNGGYNCFDDAQKLHEAYGVQAVTIFFDQLAHALVEKGANEKPFFPNAARGVAGSIMALVYAIMPPERRNLKTVFELVMFGWPQTKSDQLVDEDGNPIELEPRMALWVVMDNCSDPMDPSLRAFIKKGGASMLRGEGRNSQADVLSTLETALKWLAHKKIQDVVSTSSFTFFDLKGGRNDVIFLSAGAQAMGGALAGFVRLFFESGLYVYESRQDVTLKHKTIYLLEEGANIGSIPSVAKAGPLLRGSGCELIMVAQDIPLLRACYPNEYQNFIGNSSFTCWMTVNEETTLNFLSRSLGKRTRTTTIKQGGETRLQQDERDIITPDQLKRLLAPKRGNMITTRSSARPLITKRPDYFKELPFWKFNPDPAHPEPLLRKLGRKWFDGRLEKPASNPPAAGDGNDPLLIDFDPVTEG